MDIKEKFTEKAGPLPVWAWVVIVSVGGYVFYKYYENKKAANTAAQANTAQTTPPVGSSGDTANLTQMVEDPALMEQLNNATADLNTLATNVGKQTTTIGANTGALNTNTGALNTNTTTVKGNTAAILRKPNLPSYVTERGDTTAKLAQKFYGSSRAVNINSLRVQNSWLKAFGSGSVLPVGKTILVPVPHGG